HRLLLLGATAPRLDVVGQRDLLGQPEVAGEAVPHLLILRVGDPVPVDGLDRRVQMILHRSLTVVEGVVRSAQWRTGPLASSLGIGPHWRGFGRPTARWQCPPPLGPSMTDTPTFVACARAGRSLGSGQHRSAGTARSGAASAKGPP